MQNCAFHVTLGKLISFHQHMNRWRDATLQWFSDYFSLHTTLFAMRLSVLVIPSYR